MVSRPQSVRPCPQHYFVGHLLLLLMMLLLVKYRCNLLSNRAGQLSYRCGIKRDKTFPRAAGSRTDEPQLHADVVLKHIEPVDADAENLSAFFCRIWRSLRVRCRGELWAAGASLSLFLGTRSRISGSRPSKDSFRPFRRFTETFFISFFWTLAAGASHSFSLDLIRTYLIINISLGLQLRTVRSRLVRLKGGRVDVSDGAIRLAAVCFQPPRRHQTPRQRLQRPRMKPRFVHQSL